tara:strand:+ start:114451 stop:114618 length:168 start_codon:yes stop_codon:yes gene_type:complete
MSYVFWEEMTLLRTITIGSCVSVQGIFVKMISDERIAVQVDGKVFEGKPVGSRSF